MINKLIYLSKQICSFCVGMEGNVSAKNDKKIYIKASGSKLKKLRKNDIVEYDIEGNQVSNFNKKGSMELTFHLFLLKFKDINFVAHTHPINTVSILCSKKAEIFSKNRIFPDQVIFNDAESCLVPYAKPGLELTQKIIESVNKYIQKNDKFPKLILLKNHGIIACGRTENECIVISEICEKAAEIFIKTNNISEISFLKSEEIDNLLSDEKEKYRHSLL